MTQMNQSTKEKQTHIENRLVAAKEEVVREGWDGVGVWGLQMQTIV